MTIYVSGRQSGKTTFLIRQSADTGAVIVAPTCQMARYIGGVEMHILPPGHRGNSITTIREE